MCKGLNKLERKIEESGIAMTELKEAKRGVLKSNLDYIAEKAKVDPSLFGELVAEARVVIPVEKNCKILEPCALND